MISEFWVVNEWQHGPSEVKVNEHQYFGLYLRCPSRPFLSFTSRAVLLFCYSLLRDVNVSQADGIIGSYYAIGLRQTNDKALRLSMYKRFT